jgi:DNA-binding GntR family transcriptional regulator
MKASTLENIDRIPLRERIYQLVQRAIVSGELNPGQRVSDLNTLE